MGCHGRCCNALIRSAPARKSKARGKEELHSAPLDRTNERKNPTVIRKARTIFQQRSCKSLSSPTGLLFSRCFALAFHEFALPFQFQFQRYASRMRGTYTSAGSFPARARVFRSCRRRWPPAADQRARQASPRRKLSVPVCRLPSAASSLRLPAGSARGSRFFSFTLVAATSAPMNDRFVRCGAHALSPVPTHASRERIEKRTPRERPFRTNVSFVGKKTKKNGEDVAKRRAKRKTF